VLGLQNGAKRKQIQGIDLGRSTWTRGFGWGAKDLFRPALELTFNLTKLRTEPSPQGLFR